MKTQISGLFRTSGNPVHLTLNISETRTNNFPWKWARPRSRDLYNFWQYGRLS